MFNPKLYSILIVSLYPDFVLYVKQKLAKKGYNTYSFETAEKYTDFIKFENAKVDYFILDIRNFEFHHLLSDNYVEGIIYDMSINVSFNGLLRDKLNMSKYPIHSESLGIKYCSNNKNTYKHFFDTFSNKYSNFEDEFNAFIKNKDYAGARKLIHGVRGVSLNLGSKPLYKYAGFIDEYLKEQIDNNKKIKVKKFQKELNKVFEILNELSKIN